MAAPLTEAQEEYRLDAMIENKVWHVETEIDGHPVSMHVVENTRDPRYPLTKNRDGKIRGGRLQIFFDEIPPDEVTKKIKKRFNFSPTKGAAWQCQLHTVTSSYSGFDAFKRYTGVDLDLETPIKIPLPEAERADPCDIRLSDDDVIQYDVARLARRYIGVNAEDLRAAITDAVKTLDQDDVDAFIKSANEYHQKASEKRSDNGDWLRKSWAPPRSQFNTPDVRDIARAYQEKHGVIYQALESELAINEKISRAIGKVEGQDPRLSRMIATSILSELDNRMCLRHGSFNIDHTPYDAGLQPQETTPASTIERDKNGRLLLRVGDEYILHADAEAMGKMGIPAIGKGTLETALIQLFKDMNATENQPEDAAKIARELAKLEDLHKAALQHYTDTDGEDWPHDPKGEDKADKSIMDAHFARVDTLRGVLQDDIEQHQALLRSIHDDMNAALRKRGIEAIELPQIAARVCGSIDANLSMQYHSLLPRQIVADLGHWNDVKDIECEAGPNRAGNLSLAAKMEPDAFAEAAKKAARETDGKQDGSAKVDSKVIVFPEGLYGYDKQYAVLVELGDRYRELDRADRLKVNSIIAQHYNPTSVEGVFITNGHTDLYDLHNLPKLLKTSATDYSEGQAITLGPDTDDAITWDYETIKQESIKARDKINAAFFEKNANDLPQITLLNRQTPPLLVINLRERDIESGAYVDQLREDGFTQTHAGVWITEQDPAIINHWRDRFGVHHMEYNDYSSRGNGIYTPENGFEAIGSDAIAEQYHRAKLGYNASASYETETGDLRFNLGQTPITVSIRDLDGMFGEECRTNEKEIASDMIKALENVPVLNMVAFDEATKKYAKAKQAVHAVEDQIIAKRAVEVPTALTDALIHAGDELGKKEKLFRSALEQALFNEGIDDEHRHQGTDETLIGAIVSNVIVRHEEAHELSQQKDGPGEGTDATTKAKDDDPVDRAKDRLSALFEKTGKVYGPAVKKLEKGFAQIVESFDGEENQRGLFNSVVGKCRDDLSKERDITLVKVAAALEGTGTTVEDLLFDICQERRGISKPDVEGDVLVTNVQPKAKTKASKAPDHVVDGHEHAKAGKVKPEREEKQSAQGSLF